MMFRSSRARGESSLFIIDLEGRIRRHEQTRIQPATGMSDQMDRAALSYGSLDGFEHTRGSLANGGGYEMKSFLDIGSN